MQRNLMNDYEIGYIKLLILKYRKGDQIIKSFFKVGSPQKLGLPSKKNSLNHTEDMKI